MKSYKTEINPTPDQMEQIRKTIGTCRFIYNFYLSHNKEEYDKGNKFITANDFSKWLNNEFIPNNQEYSWIKDVSTKATKQAMINAEKAFKKFFSGKAKYPRFKKKNRSDVKMYFTPNGLPNTTKVKRHKLKIPTLGWVKLKEKGYIPTKSKVINGHVSYKAGRYYVSITTDDELKTPQTNTNEPLGIDLGISNLAIASNGSTFKNINKTKRMKKLKKKLKREQRSLSRKLEANKKSKKKGEATTRQNIAKNKLRIQKIHQTIQNIRSDNNNKVINTLVKTKPAFITIEDLNIKGMMKNKHLSRAIQEQAFYEFRSKLTIKCEQYNIPLRIASRTFASSKTCSNCGTIKKDLKLSDRVYTCLHCGLKIDRDINAAINLKNTSTYKIA